MLLDNLIFPTTKLEVDIKRKLVFGRFKDITDPKVIASFRFDNVSYYFYKSLSKAVYLYLDIIFLLL